MEQFLLWTYIVSAVVTAIFLLHPEVQRIGRERYIQHNMGLGIPRYDAQNGAGVVVLVVTLGLVLIPVLNTASALHNLVSFATALKRIFRR